MDDRRHDILICGHEIAHPLVIDFGRPTRTDQTVNSRLGDDFPQMEQIKDGGIVDRDGDSNAVLFTRR